MDRGAWQATIHGVTRVRHNLATEEMNDERIYIFIYPKCLSIHLLLDIRLFPCLGYCELWGNEHRVLCIFLNYNFDWIYAQE